MSVDRDTLVDLITAKVFLKQIDGSGLRRTRESCGGCGIPITAALRARRAAAQQVPELGRIAKQGWSIAGAGTLAAQLDVQRVAASAP